MQTRCLSLIRKCGSCMSHVEAGAVAASASLAASKAPSHDLTEGQAAAASLHVQIQRLSTELKAARTEAGRFSFGFYDRFAEERTHIREDSWGLKHIVSKEEYDAARRVPKQIQEQIAVLQRRREQQENDNRAVQLQLEQEEQHRRRLEEEQRRLRREEEQAQLNRGPAEIQQLLTGDFTSPLDAFRCGLHDLLPVGIGICPDEAHTLVPADLVEVRQEVRFSARGAARDALALVGVSVSDACLRDTEATRYLEVVKALLQDNIELFAPGGSMIADNLAEPVEYPAKKVTMNVKFDLHGQTWSWPRLGVANDALHMDVSFIVSPRSPQSVLARPKNRRFAGIRDNMNSNSNSGDNDNDDDDDDDNDDANGDVLRGVLADEDATGDTWQVGTNVSGVFLNMPYDHALRLEDGTLLFSYSRMPEFVLVRHPANDCFRVFHNASEQPRVHLGTHGGAMAADSLQFSHRSRQRMDLVLNVVSASSNAASITPADAFHCALYGLVPRSLGLDVPDACILTPSNLLQIRRDLSCAAPAAAKHALDLVGMSVSDACLRDPDASAYLSHTKALLRDNISLFRNNNNNNGGELLDKPAEYAGKKVSMDVHFDVHGHTWSWPDLGGAGDKLHIDATFFVAARSPESVLENPTNDEDDDGGALGAGPSDPSEGTTWEIATNMPGVVLHAPLDFAVRLVDDTLLFRSRHFPQHTLMRSPGQDCFLAVRRASEAPVVDLAIPKRARKQ